MDGFVILSLMMKVGFAIVAVYGAVAMLRWLDRRSGVRFSDDILAAMRREPMALAIYYGARIVAACLLIGLVIS